MSGEEHTLDYELFFRDILGEQDLEGLRFALGDTNAIRREYKTTERGSERWAELRAQMVDIKCQCAYVCRLLGKFPVLSNSIIRQFVRAVYGEDRPESVARVRRWLCKVQKPILSSCT